MDKKTLFGQPSAWLCLLILLSSISALAGMFALAKDTAFWRSMVITPEPEQCVLCDHDYHAPVLLNAAAGTLMELREDPPPASSEHGQINPVYFCHACRSLLADTDTNWVILEWNETQQIWSVIDRTGKN